MNSGAIVVAKEKNSPKKTTPVKIDTGLVRKAKTIAEDKGLDLSEYLSEVIRVQIDRDWAKILKRILESEDDGK